jgi:hypothetical protein
LRFVYERAPDRAEVWICVDKALSRVRSSEEERYSMLLVSKIGSGGAEGEIWKRGEVELTSYTYALTSRANGESMFPSTGGSGYWQWECG